MQAARLPFSEMELTVLRICERNGWTQEYFHGLSDKEKQDRLAYDYRRQMMIQNMIEVGFTSKIDEKKPIDMPAYVMLLLAEMV